MRITVRPEALNVFGPALKRAREAAKLTQDELAARVSALGLSVDRTIISRIENQQRAITDIEQFFLCEALRVDLIRLFRLMRRVPGRIPQYDQVASEFDDLRVRVAEEDEELYP